jgi:hypothetical protein
MVVAIPWLVNNYALFGSIVPISGISESRGAHFGQNLAGVPANLFSAAFLYAPVPSAIQREAPVILLALLCVPASLWGFWHFAAKHALPARRFFLAGIVFTACISFYYGLFFGAGHFLGRYIYPLSPFLWLATAATTFFVLSLLFRSFTGFQRASSAVVLVLAAGAVLFAGSDFVRGYSKGTSQMHKQVVEWVQKNVPESQWVGAPQTGALGFFHDRTINLDGKVNPDALRAILDRGHVLEYVRKSRIDYIADWYGMADWVKMKHSPQFGQEFEVVVRDEQANLGVLRRIRPVQP